MYRLIVAFYSMFFFQFSSAQNYSEDMAGILNNYMKNDIHISITNTVEKLNNNEKVSKNVSVKMHSQDHYYLTSGDIEMLVTPKIKVVVDHQQKTVLVDSNYMENNVTVPTSLFDTLQKMYKTINYEKLNDENASYTLIPNSGEPKSIELNFNYKTSLINSVIILYYDGRVKSDILLSNNYSYNVLKVNDIPSLNSYYTIINGELLLQDKYKYFELLNFLNN